MKNNYGLVDHCKKALAEKWGYVWGTYGKVLTSDLLQRKLTQYPKEVGRYLDYIKRNYINKRAADCVGLIKSFVWWNSKEPVYDADTDKSANGMFNAAKISGNIEMLPEIPGACLWKDGHVGVYIGNGKVIEAKGTKYGVIQSPIKGIGANKWTHWFFCPYIEYVDEVTAYKAIIQEHIKLDAPEILWDLLDKHPYAKDLYRKLVDSYKK
jgi:hypothetical protein